MANQPIFQRWSLGLPAGNDHRHFDGERLKEIASELDHSVRPVQRERELRLPIHRLRQAHRKPKPEVIISMEKFFDAQSAHQKERRCSRCRSDMKHLDVHLWLLENG